MQKKNMLNNLEISSFCSQTAMIFQAGITPVEGMSLLIADMKTADGRKLYQTIYDVCSTGDTFHHAVLSTGVFPDYVLNMISLGEASGNLDTVMQSLAAYYEREEEISRSISDAIRYPLIMIIMMFAIIIVLMTKVLPVFRQVFRQLGGDMSSISMTLLQIGTQINRYSIIFLFLLFLILILYIWSLHSEKGHRLFSSLWYHIWFTRNFYNNIAAERFASGLALALGSGLDTFHSLDLTQHLIDHPVLQKKIIQCKSDVENGASFTEALASTGIFSNFYMRMISIGCRTGSADIIMRKIAEEYDQENSRHLQSVISILEPVLVIILSLIIGLILLSVILPLLGIMSSIG